MQLLIDGQPQNFIDLREFRTRFNLPENFGIGLFEPKDYTGLGSIEDAGAEMGQLRSRILARLPKHMTIMDWLREVSELQQYFWQQLIAINHAVGLRDPEIDFAAAGFGDVCRAIVYAQIRAHAGHLPTPTFDPVYAEWLASTVKVASMIHRYEHDEQTWQIRIISHAYGRMGLYVLANGEEWYIYDHRLACPAEGFMVHLLREVANHILTNSV